MAFDLVVRNAALPDGRKGQDVAVAAGRIVAIGPGLESEAGETVDARGFLLAPPFVDCHFHMDATLSLGQPRLNQSGTLLEGIALWGELKPHLTHEAVAQRALRYCDLAVSQGLLAVRSHVDICDDRLLAVEALIDVKKRVAPYLDLQLVAFPQDGYFRSPSAAGNLKRALDLGVDAVGGIPHFERTMADGAASVRALCEIAAARGLMIDLHCDESDDPMSRHIETLAAEVHRLGLGGRATGSHLTSMHSMDNYYVSKLLPLIAESGMNAIANPLINLTLQGRHDTYPRRRGMTRVAEMRALGVPVALGQDCVMDPWYGLGGADMLDVAHMAVHGAPMTSREAIRWTFDAVTEIPARILGLEHYGLAVGANADFVLLQAADPIEAVRLRATRLVVVRRGRVIARTPARETALGLAGRPPTLDPAAYAPR
ncbi:cytosine deaminase [Roseiarcus fermentans]|uniref:Cytosine deaminase n=1 Tax=Roseiarcus fermentans TaxID=1473586 RepID=A0A366EVU7_9HYPH|nr:amidohydrolase family protein [Roseiarcus fermentans]RBP06512.1 cytosine deaminase [Roseiarcus fermentans]